jgi:hypothetical protein
VVPELAGVAGRAAGPRRRRARVARRSVAREARVDVAGGLPGAGEVVVVLHWFLGSSLLFLLAVYWPGPGQLDKGGGGGRWWSSLGARRAGLLKGGGQGKGALFVLDPLFSVGFHGADSARQLEVDFVLALLVWFGGSCGLVCVISVSRYFFCFLVPWLVGYKKQERTSLC